MLYLWVVRWISPVITSIIAILHFGTHANVRPNCRHNIIYLSRDFEANVNVVTPARHKLVATRIFLERWSTWHSTIGYRRSLNHTCRI